MTATISVPYFNFPFAVDGTTAVVEDSLSATGEMSYQYGFTPSYEEDLLTNPDALPIPRSQMNQLFFDVTSVLQTYQLQGTYPWYSVADGGPPDGYPIYARVLHNYVAGGFGNQIYECVTVVDGFNTNEPGTPLSGWRIISDNQQGTLPGTIIDFASPVTPSGYLACDGSAVLRATYADLFDAICPTQIPTTINDNPQLTGLVGCNSRMYVGMTVEGSNITDGTATIVSIDSDTSITLSANANTSGSSTAVRFFNWGAGNGSTTFNVPALNTYTTIGQNGQNTLGTAFPDSVVTGQSGGEATYQLQANDLPVHTHDAGGGSFLVTASPGTNALGAGSGSQQNANTGNNSTTNSAINLMQLSAVVNKCIKT